ncbi:ras GTPase-activating-like protein IQGAP1 isoform X2 [Aplysia californica]|uniref:Ras GTPase-activating-like protein IQGAP1 isoform X2 n=1 Tax=Aplysia californica TaxID=6500 RepID=A0ABM1A6S4_APLCA|nr:ras GTPase-activating-like protein IQGAP1 isoform X2 [Aplysia californica]
MEQNEHKPHYRTLEDERLTADEMDEQRKRNIAYEYLCHLEEAKIWIEACINEELPTSTELEEGLRNGVYLAKLGHFFAPSVAPLKKIYDKEQTRYNSRGLHFRHTDNINHWLRAMDEIGLPSIFYPETTDIYDRKNMPRAVYCVHALSLFLFKLGLAPQIQDLYGKINFTEEEISAMRKELDKYGIQMPAFSKIGGILANELTVDDAALHAAIIAINEAVDQQVAADTYTAMQNPSAMLVNLDSENVEQYQQLLYEAKNVKAENAKNKSIDPDSTYEHDVYDELLTQAEIQGNVSKVNTNQALIKVDAAFLSGDRDALLAALQSPALGLKNVNPDNIDFYIAKLALLRLGKSESAEADIALSKDEIQNAVNEANLEADSEYQKSQMVLNVNQALSSRDAELLMKALQNPTLKLGGIHSSAAQLYVEELASMREEKGEDLDFNDIEAALKVIAAVVAINKAIDAGDPHVTFTALQEPDAHILDLDESIEEKYQTNLATQKSNKADQPNDLLTHGEILACIEGVHTQVHEEHEISLTCVSHGTVSPGIKAITQINEAIDKGEEAETVQALQLSAAKLRDIQPEQALHYQILLARQKDKKAEDNNDDAAVLWLEEIQACVDKANANCQEGLKMSRGVASVNQALKEDNKEALLTSLTSSEVNVHSVTGDCIEGYQQALLAAVQESSKEGETGSGWMMNRLKDGTKFFYNIETGAHAWTRGDNIIKDYALLNKEDIQRVVSEVTAEYDREMLFKSNEGLITKIQANVRGHLARKAYKERKNFMNTQLPAILKIQACWRGAKQRHKYKDRVNLLKDNTDSVILLQSYYRMWKARTAYRNRLKYFKDNEDAIVKIQAYFRSNLARQDYKALTTDDNPSLGVVRKFVHLLDASDNDYSEELELQKLRQQVVAEIRSNQQLEQDLDQMDIKIGLLIKNRITLQDVVTHNKKLTKRTSDDPQLRGGGLKALSKENHERLETYQHLFYLLQTCPNYLAKLIFEMPQSRTTKFMEAVIYSLFNYGANQREEYLLTKLFQTALEEEINSKVDKMTDIVTGNPLVVKMIVGFNRNQRGQNALKEMLSPLITSVIEDRNLRINTNPVEVYKAWVNQTESSTGKASGLPYDVSTEQALKHEEVRTQIEETIKRLQGVTDRFLNKILSSLDSIPYGMRYMAKVMRECLLKKFPDAPEKDVLKIVGNLLYYRYINSAIVAPDAFDIINVGAEKALSSDQRRNLGSIAKILQFAASNKGFGGESAYLASMNDYIRNAHEKFKKYCLSACDVEEPEARFNVDQYSDVTMIAKPVVYISVGEIVDTHQLLLKHQDTIAPEGGDPLHELLEELGEAPTIDELLGTELTGDEAANDALRSQMAKTEISLTLSSKFEVHTDDKADMKSLLIRTKRMIVDVIACQPGDNLVLVLDAPCNQQQEELHQALVKKRDLIDKKATQTQKDKGQKLVRHASILGDTRLPIEVMKTKVKANLQSLELAGMVSKQNKYQALLNSIVQDIRNQRRYRNNRKQELMRLRATIKSLSEKRTFYESQIDYYNQYVKTCMDNLQQKTKKNRKSGLFHRGDSKKQGSVTYTATRLHEKGVVLEIEGLPQNQFKNVVFEIGATEDPGVFSVNAKFMGVQMDKVELVFQDLLQLQYEGVAVMKMFNKAKINVNLLIFLLNRKFYGKQLGK